MRSKDFLKLFFLVSFLSSYSFPANAQLSTVGKEFWFGFMDNFRVEGNTPENTALDYGIVIITASEQASGILQYGNTTIDFNLNAGQQLVHRIEDFDILSRLAGVVENKGVYINSSGNIAVHAFNERRRSADGTVILPLSALGKDYYVTSHYEVMTVDVNYNANVNDESTLLIVAVEENTRLEITPSVNTLTGNAAGTPFNIELNTGQSYQLKARDDLTGTRVRVVGDTADDCKNLAVFGGNKWTSVGNCGGANDHLYQQMYPTATWGMDYIHISYDGRSSGELVKVLASENNTTVTINGENAGTINAGQFLTFDFPSDFTASIKTSKPSAVTGFSKSQECNNPAEPFYLDGDPFMITYSPNEQLLTSITFNAIQLPSINRHYVNILVKSDAVNQTSLDGQMIGGNFQPVPGDPEYAFSRIFINQGVHRLDNPEGFIAYVYGFGEIESYGYATGASLDNLNFEVEPEYEFDVEGERVACLNQVADWEIFPENEVFTYFVWDFGDDSDAKIGKLVNHVYTEPGTYEVKVTASISEFSCDLQEEITFEVSVLETDGEIGGLNSVCPDVEELTYGFFSDSPFSKVEWIADGGEVLEVNSTGTRAKVAWGTTNPNASLTAIPYTIEGCPGEPIVIPVTISEVIIAENIEGDTKICFDPNSITTYTIPNPSDSRTYTWEVTNGQIVGPTDEASVQVRWDQENVIGELLYRTNSILNPDCFGESEVLFVEVGGAFDVEIGEVEDLVCFEDNSGQISIKVSGGVAPFTFEWSHDPTLNEAIATSLSSGSYNVKVKDSFGCELLIENIEVSQPDLFSVNRIDKISPSCFGRDDAEAILILQGGTLPYTLDIPNAMVEGNEIRILDLPFGFHEFEVLDANLCQLQVSFEIEETPAETFEVRVQKPTCPGESNGELLAIPDARFGPLTYSWEFDGSSDALLAGVPSGTYEVEVQDSRGCISVGIGILLEEGPKVRMPTGFNPEEGLYEGVSNCETSFTITIFNRWGQMIFTGNSGWDGKIADRDAPMGSYSYLVRYDFILNGEQKSEEQRGIFTLIR
ncbi:MAG: PKD domain-containing protein [Mongoliibacter sp.]|uniref:PKD domain-containing protein n=1 Tax=Mongoliibacter sp. TaxID=2022438 RepID=UPI0012F040D4|nr:PKD domain-containing protein [Mongoliibacter sp.]TVP42783.1 MAG: PKD domain-containing protein [Mongoliibacter sp.]